jgi:hypothetical protein
MRFHLIEQLIKKFYDHEVSLREVIIELDAEEMDEFIDMYDEFVKSQD